MFDPYPRVAASTSLAYGTAVPIMVAVAAVPLRAVFKARALFAAAIGSLAVPTTNLIKLINFEDSTDDALET